MQLISTLILLLFSQLHAMSDIDQLISEASSHNAYFLYEDAVKFLDEAIKLNPYEKEAYKERAFSYFELNRIDLALEDYKRVIDPKSPYGRRIQNFSSLGTYPSMLSNIPPYLDFAQGLLDFLRNLLCLEKSKIFSEFLDLTTRHTRSV